MKDRSYQNGAETTYAIEFVADMTRAVTFYRDIVGLTLTFESPGWPRFSTGETTLALHPASDKNPPGQLDEMGFGAPDLHDFFNTMAAKGVASTEARTQSTGVWKPAGAVSGL